MFYLSSLDSIVRPSLEILIPLTEVSVSRTESLQFDPFPVHRGGEKTETNTDSYEERASNN